MVLIALLYGQKLVFSLPVDGVVRLGRGTSNDIRLSHNSISRCHAVFHCESGRVMVEDVGSRNGTRLFSSTQCLEGEEPDPRSEDTQGSSADYRIEPGQSCPLAPGDLLRVGGVLIRVQTEEQGGEEAAGESTIVEDPATRRVYQMAARIAASSISVLILGETGVGKDVLARSIHMASPRANKPFVRIHCASLAESLLESELFGHVRGAFTGAIASKEGLIESADGGTVFLDELGEMSLGTQIKLLNVLETGHVTRIGTTEPRAIDVRFVAATNRDLPSSVESGTFRRDLYFRINGITLRLPPLRQRPADIEPLALRFLVLGAARYHRPVARLAPEALDRLRHWAWPGNVRELRNVIDRALLLCSGDVIRPEDIVLEADELMPLDADHGEEKTSASSAVYEVHSSAHAPRSVKSPEAVVRALEECFGNQTRAAELLGISRRTLLNWLDEFGTPRPRKGR